MLRFTSCIITSFSGRARLGLVSISGQVQFESEVPIGRDRDAPRLGLPRRGSDGADRGKAKFHLPQRIRLRGNWCGEGSGKGSFELTRHSLDKCGRDVARYLIGTFSC